EPSRRLDIHNNLFDEIGGRWGEGHFLQLLDGADQVSVTHNTIMNGSRMDFAEGLPSSGFVFSDNIAFHNDYGISGSGTASGPETLASYLPGSSIQNNLIIGGEIRLYPEGNQIALEVSRVEFIDAGNGNY